MAAANQNLRLLEPTQAMLLLRFVFRSLIGLLLGKLLGRFVPILRRLLRLIGW